MFMEKYICENCGVEVPCTNWDKAIAKEKKCDECFGTKRKSIDTIRRINSRAHLLGKFVDANYNIVDKQVKKRNKLDKE